jgi:hypothetical protein
MIHLDGPSVALYRVQLSAEAIEARAREILVELDAAEDAQIYAHSIIPLLDLQEVIVQDIPGRLLAEVLGVLVEDLGQNLPEAPRSLKRSRDELRALQRDRLAALLAEDAKPKPEPIHAV